MSKPCNGRLSAIRLFMGLFTTLCCFTMRNVGSWVRVSFACRCAGVPFFLLFYCVYVWVSVSKCTLKCVIYVSRSVPVCGIIFMHILGVHVSLHAQMLHLKNVFICVETLSLCVFKCVCVLLSVCARTGMRAVCQLCILSFSSAHFT